MTTRFEQKWLLIVSNFFIAIAKFFVQTQINDHNFVHKAVFHQNPRLHRKLLQVTNCKTGSNNTHIMISNKNQTAAIHINITSHTFDYKNSQIITTENQLNKRLTLEFTSISPLV